MPSSLIDADSVLAVDVGSCTTRAMLFDVVEGGYRFIAVGQAPTSAMAPVKDVGEGVVRAIENLQETTGRLFLDSNRSLIIPTKDGVGIDSFVATISAGPSIKTVIVGLLDEVSLQSVNRLACSTYANVVDNIGVNDPRKPEEQIDSILHLEPDLILIAGGTNDGAIKSVQKKIDIIGLACFLMPAENRPSVLFVGNQAVAKDVTESLSSLTSSLNISPNIRPSLDVEDIQPASYKLANTFMQIRRNKLGGVEKLASWANGNLLPTAYAQGRMIRFMSQTYKSKGILGVDIGASATTIASGFQGELALGVYPQFGLGENLSDLLRYTSLDDILRWLPLDIPANNVRDYLYQKSVYPESIPVTIEDMAIEQAITRQVLRLAIETANKEIPANFQRPSSGGFPFFEPILVSGSAITNAATIGQGLLMILDGIQPVGTTTIILDQNHLLPGMGAAAGINPILPVQILESGAFMGLASLVAPISNVRLGTPILRGRLVTKEGTETKFEINQGTLDVLPLPGGQSGQLFLEPLHRSDVGFGPGRSGEVQVSGTQIGVVIDARGRPIQLSKENGRRFEMIKKWIWTLGG
ncbi:MAG: glutamate mutase L [Chloroflexota bacterium]